MTTNPPFTLAAVPFNLETCHVRCLIHDSVNGNPVPGATFQFVLNTFEVELQGYVAPEQAIVTADESGEAFIDLWPNELGNVSSYYNVRITAYGKVLKVTAVIPALTDCNLWEVAQLPPFEGSSQGGFVTSEIIGYMNAAQAAASASQVSANNAAASAQAALISEGNANFSATTASNAAQQAALDAATATAAASTATTASGSAQSSATAANNAAAAAQASANAAKASELAAGSYATTASNMAGSASTSAGTATQKATDAANSAAAALASQNAAKTSETNSKASETAAGTSATNAANSAAAAAASEAHTVQVANSVGLSGALVNPSGHLIVSRGDATQYDAGYVKGDPGAKGDPGTGIAIKGTLPDSSQLPPTGNTEGDAYIIGSNLWVWTGTAWTNVGPFVGPPGTTDYNQLQNKPPLGTSSPLNVANTGDASTTQVVVGSDSRLTDARVPKPHQHAISDITGLSGALVTYAPLESPSFTGTVSGITKPMVGLPNVDNTSDLNKPISVATQTALNTKIGEAPTDGKQYARTLASWAEVISAMRSTIDDAAPATPKYNDRWIRPATGQESVWVPTADGKGAWWSPAGADDDITPPVAIAQGGTGATTAANARLNLGIVNASGQTLLADGTKAAPGLAFGSELGLGMYRAGAGSISWATSGQRVFAWDSSASTATSQGIWPRTSVGGSSILALYNSVEGDANSGFFTITMTSNGQAELANNKGGTGLATSIALKPADGFVTMSGATTSTLYMTATGASGSTVISMNKLGNGEANSFFGSTNNKARWGLYLGNTETESGGSTGSNFGINRFDDNGGYVGTPLVINRATGDVTLANTLAVARGHTTKFGISGGFQGNVFNIAWDTTGVGSSRVYIDDVWSTVAMPSDERLKENITDLALTDEMFLGIRTIEFDWKHNLSHAFGFSAQNVLARAPRSGAVSGNEAMMYGLDDRPLLAMTVNRVQDLIKRLEAALARIAQLETA